MIDRESTIEDIPSVEESEAEQPTSISQRISPRLGETVSVGPSVKEIVTMIEGLDEVLADTEWMSLDEPQFSMAEFFAASDDENEEDKSDERTGRNNENEAGEAVEDAAPHQDRERLQMRRVEVVEQAGVADDDNDDEDGGGAMAPSSFTIRRVLSMDGLDLSAL